MVVQVRLNALLRKYALQGNPEPSLQLPEGHTITDLVQELGIPLPNVDFATVNLKYSSLSQTLKDSDHATLFPLLTGGSDKENGS